MIRSLRILAVVSAMALLPCAAWATLTAQANHDHITIDFFYSGSEVSVSGVSDPGVDLVVKITSPEGHQELKKKGKVGGVLWMNVGGLEFKNTPNLYFLQSTRKIEDMLSESEMERYIIGYPALERHVVAHRAA
ncbi:MAG: TIGR02186 family protein, partial [Nitrospirota bacterium]